MKNIIKILKDNSPMLLGDLIRILVKETGISNDVARQRISRAIRAQGAPVAKMMI